MMPPPQDEKARPPTNYRQTRRQQDKNLYLDLDVFAHYLAGCHRHRPDWPDLGFQVGFAGRHLPAGRGHVDRWVMAAAQPDPEMG